MNPDPVKFLLVDDTEENLTALEGLLRRDGLELLKARSGAEALELLLRHEVSLALLDVQMPEMDGFELAELMRGSELTKHIPIIFVTAGSRDPKRMFKGYETGAVDFLFKPIEPHVLKSKADVFFELSRKRKELASVLRLNELFVGILGHDLRNPLGAVLTGGQFLESQLTDDLQLRTVRRMLSAGERMKAMVEQLLDLTRARLAGGLGFLRESKCVDLGALVRRAAEELQSAHPERAIEIEVRGDATTQGDADRLLQLMSNLISNALHHGAADAPVTLMVLGEDRQVTFRVRNRGSVPPERISTLFDPFRSGQGHKSSSKGLGLGLYISQQIALAHGGTIRLGSEGGFTEVSVSIPRKAAVSESARPTRALHD
ncbi:MAG: hybrid sensor histidine kinase/response regulator [Polyangiaceae bacterium]